MLAAQINRFGGPEVLELHEVARPEPAAGEVQVAVEAASVNGHDMVVRSGGLKFVTGRRFPIGVGLDFVGTVSALGDGVDDHVVGEHVWGLVHPRQKHTIGSAAEYVVLPAHRVSKAPVALPAADAAALVVAGTTALIALEKLRLKPGQRLLIRGAAGGVGSAAVQLAGTRGVHITALAGTRQVDDVRLLGADVVLDRRTTRPRDIGTFDAVLDTAGTELAAWRRIVAPHGRMVTVALSGTTILAAALSTVHGSRRIRTFSADPGSLVLQTLASHADDGTIRPVVASSRPLADVADAHRAFERGGTIGKHTITVSTTP